MSEETKNESYAEQMTRIRREERQAKRKALKQETNRYSRTGRRKGRQRKAEKKENKKAGLEMVYGLMKRDELRRVASKKGIPRYSRLKKDELIEALLDAA